MKVDQKSRAQADEMVDVSISQVPRSVLQHLRTAAAKEGIVDSNAAAMRWAAVQFSKVLRDAANKPAG